jgi:hypothetical protein
VDVEKSTNHKLEAKADFQGKFRRSLEEPSIIIALPLPAIG